MPRRSASLELAVEESEQLDRWIRAGATPQQVVLCAKIVRQAAKGSTDKQIAADLSVHPRTVALWRHRVRDEGLEGIWQVAAGRGRKPSFGATTVSGWIERTLQTQPVGATHWSTRSLGKAVGVSKNTIHRAWQDHQLKPHLTKTFKLSRDPQFVEKLTDVVGVYLKEATRVLKPGGFVLFMFLEFQMRSHWAIFEASLNSLSKNLHLDQFVSRDAIVAWAERLPLDLVAIHDGEKPHIPLASPITFEDGRTMTRLGHFGQSVAVLKKPVARLS